ncbi:MAG TPA: CNNM domain-containing protein [Chthoniobacterales bacterium]
MIWFAIIACIIIAFLFSGIESGVVSINRVRLRHNAGLGAPGARELEALLAHPGRLIVTVTLVTTGSKVLALSLLFSVFARHFGHLGEAAALVACLPVFAVLVEVIPKAIFSRFPYRTLVFFARILQIANWLVYPISALAEWIARPLVHASQETHARHITSVEGIRRAVNESTSKSALQPLQKHLMHSVLNFREIRAGKLMLPIEKVVSVTGESWVSDALDLARQTQIDRLPVLNANGEVTGLLQIFDLLIDGVKSGRVQSYARRVIAVRPDEPAIEVLIKLRAARLAMAVVTDANGKALGILPAEDLVRKMLLG